MTSHDYVANAGILPERTTDPGEAFLFWCIDGASILVTGRTDAQALVEAVREIFGTHLPGELTLRMVATNADPTQLGYDPTTRTILSDAANRLDAHTDGARGFSDEYPDLLALLCARQATSGGESFLVDGQYLCDAIARDPARRHLARFLWGVPIEQCVPMADALPGSPTSLRSRRPVVSRTPGGRLTVRYHQHQRVLDEGPVDEQDRVHLDTWRRLGQQAAAAAPRFLLRPGDLLSVDNYRVFHGREPYQGTDRLLHRILGFTDMSFRASTREPSPHPTGSRSDHVH